MLQQLLLIILINFISFQSLSFAETKRLPTYKYTYNDREHTFSEDLKHIGAIYVISWGFYYLTQPDTFKERGSFKNYKRNFGKIVFDQDEPFWNWMVHPYSGSQLYLYYRANGYNQIKSATMSFISSSLFEFAIENYTEPASIQDLYQTPLLGSSLGLVFEHLSLYLLNTGNPFLKFCGHIINPYTLFWFYDGKIQITPKSTSNTKGLFLRMEF